MLGILLFLSAAGASAQTMTQSQNAGHKVPQSVEDAMGQLEKAKGDVERIRKMGGDTTEARGKVDAAEKGVEDARVKALASESGLSEDQIRTMRTSGKGWGVIAKETGVHPGTLGVGHANQAAKGGKDGGADAKDAKSKKDKPPKEKPPVKEKKGKSGDGLNDTASGKAKGKK